MDHKMTLYERTLELLRGRPEELTLSKICKETGLKIDWIAKFVQGKVTDPSVNKVQKLYEYLTKSTLKV